MSVIWFDEITHAAKRDMVYARMGKGGVFSLSRAVANEMGWPTKTSVQVGWEQKAKLLHIRKCEDGARGARRFTRSTSAPNQTTPGSGFIHVMRVLETLGIAGMFTPGQVFRTIHYHAPTPESLTIEIPDKENDE